MWLLYVSYTSSGANENQFVCQCDSQHFTALPQVQMFESQQRSKGAAH